MKQVQNYSIHSNTPLTDCVYEMVLEGDGTWVERPGQFMEIEIPNQFLKRPISISSHTDTTLTIVYKVVGKGTKWMSEQSTGTLTCITGLGNGFAVEEAGDEVVLIGGGVGVPPLYGCAQELVKMGKKVDVILGFNTASEVFYEEQFKALGCKVHVATADGSKGFQGFVTDVLEQKGWKERFYMACGPLPMLKALSIISTDGLVSLEQRMGCGFGACMGCSIQTRNGNKRVCCEGPVFRSEEVVWEN